MYNDLLDLAFSRVNVFFKDAILIIEISKINKYEITILQNLIYVNICKSNYVFSIHNHPDFILLFYIISYTYESIYFLYKSNFKINFLYISLFQKRYDILLCNFFFLLFFIRVFPIGFISLRIHL